MLAPAQRLTAAAEFRLVTRRGRRGAATSLALHLHVPTGGPTVDHGQPRAGFVVSKAVGNAVVRNRVKRRLRHLVRDRLPGLAPGSLLVVRALPASARAAYAELGSDLDAALSRAQEKSQKKSQERAQRDAPPRVPA